MNIIKKYKISGAIGLTILRYNNKEIYIFYDQHNNDEYCNASNSKFLDEILDEILEKHFINNDSIIILEELLDYGVKDQIITIWKETKHTIRFKEFFLKHKHRDNVIPFDIRTILFPLSPYLLINFDKKEVQNEFPEMNSNKINDVISNMKVYEFFYPLMYFFDLVVRNDELHIKFDKIIVHLKKIKKEILSCFKSIGTRDKDISDKVYYHFKTIKNNALYFKQEYYDKNHNVLLSEFRKKYATDSDMINYMYKNIMNDPDLINNYGWVDIIEILSDSIIEFYALMIFFCRNKDLNFLHSGLAHSSSIVWLLRNHYGFDSIIDIGLTENYVTDQNIYRLPIVQNCIGL